MANPIIAAQRLKYCFSIIIINIAVYSPEHFSQIRKANVKIKRKVEQVI